MGEISEVLRQARREHQQRREQASAPAPAPEPRRREPAPYPSAPIPAAPERPAAAAPPAPKSRPRASADALAALPQQREGDWAGRAVVVDPMGPHAESFRRFALQVHRRLQERRARTLFVTSGVRREGKTTVACNLALALASMGSAGRVALVDLDLRGPRVASALGVTCRVGFDVVIRGEAELGSARLRVESPGLDLYLVPRSVAAAYELLAEDAFGAALLALRSDYDTVVIDTPPVLLFPDTEFIAGHVDAGVAVVRSGVTARSAFRPVLDAFPREKLLGVFLNGAARPRYARHQYPYGEPAATGEGTAG